MTTINSYLAQQMIMTFFNNTTDLTSDYVDRIELEPIKLDGNIYLTGFKRNFSNTPSLEAHIKIIRKIQVSTDSNPNGDEYYFMEPDNDFWFPCTMLSEDTLIDAISDFEDKFDEVKEFHVLDVSYKEKGKEIHHSETILYQNKKTGYKDAIKFRKEYEQCSIKFHVFQRDHKQTDFEIVTAAESDV